MNAPAVARRGRRNARQAANSSAIEFIARAGMAAQGVLYILVGLLALRIAFGEGSGGKQADQSGALRELGEHEQANTLIDQRFAPLLEQRL